MKESPNLDLLRTLAVLLVLFDHTMEFLGYPYLGRFEMHQLGILGVLFFFVHTALVLMFSLERLNHKTEGWPLAVSFYIRRFFRIYPLAVFFLLAMVVLKIPSTHLSPHVITYEPPDAWKFISNLLLTQNLTHHHRGSIIGQYWSLPLEVQMYALLPFLYAITKIIKNPGLLLSLWASIIVLFAYLQGTSLHVQIMEYIPNFMAGVIAYTLYIQAGGDRKISAKLWAPFLMGLAMIYMNHPTKMTGWLICGILGVAVSFFREISSVWTKSIVKVIARYSYGIYISHFFSIWFAFGKFASAPIGAQWLIYLSLLIILPDMLYHCIEKPGITLGMKWAERFENHAAFETGGLKKERLEEYGYRQSQMV